MSEIVVAIRKLVSRELFPDETIECLVLIERPTSQVFEAPMASRITQLAVVDALFVAVALRHKNRTVEQLQNAREELLKRRITGR